MRVSNCVSNAYLHEFHEDLIGITVETLDMFPAQVFGVHNGHNTIHLSFLFLQIFSFVWYLHCMHACFCTNKDYYYYYKERGYQFSAHMYEAGCVSQCFLN